VWALGACVGRSRRPDLPPWAAAQFEQALPAVPEMTSPRAWAFTLLGIHEYLCRFGGDRVTSQVREALTARLVGLYERSSTAGWRWFEEIVAYDNARLPHALLVSGDPKAVEVGLEALRWLVGVQRAPRGHFRAIGCHGFYRKGHEPAQFDQQPIEANATVSACLEAYRATREARWMDEARSAFEWFLGRNDLGQDLYDPVTGGCCDGLQEDRVNRNQGAESTLAFLLSLAEMSLLETSLAVFNQTR
jgi:hypothetical protein